MDEAVPTNYMVLDTVLFDNIAGFVYYFVIQITFKVKVSKFSLSAITSKKRE